MEHTEDKLWLIGVKPRVTGISKSWNVILACVASAFNHADGWWSAHWVAFSFSPRCRKEYERKVQTSETFIHVTMIRLLVARLSPAV